MTHSSTMRSMLISSLRFLRIRTGLQGTTLNPATFGSGIQKTLTTATPLAVRLVLPRNSHPGDAPASFMKVWFKNTVSRARGDSSVLHPRHKVQLGSLCFDA